MFADTLASSTTQKSLHRLIFCIGLLSLHHQTQAQDTHLFWGDTHVHTSWSVDSYSTGNFLIGPDEAYRYAKGLPVKHPTLGIKVQIGRPLDFMVVGDHAENFRRQVNIREAIPLLKDLPGFNTAVAFLNTPRTMGELTGVDPDVVAMMESKEVLSYGWALQVDAAENHNEPGTFTTFAGWEWTRNPGGNQHRIVFTAAGPEQTKAFVPFSTVDGPDPEDLWNFLDETTARLELDFVSMPHNSNLSNGTMFNTADSDGRPLDAAYARTRARWEPVMEITQVKGTSEVHPELSPDDDFADFEIHTDLLIGGQGTVATAQQDYARYALMNGIAQEAEMGVNPFKLGFIGSSDSHTGLADLEEDNFPGKTTTNSLLEERKDTPLTGFFHPWELSASGIAAVWAEENTREAIFSAFKRRETYGTSGTRIALRLFAGFNFDESDVSADLTAAGYRKGVPMGSDLASAGNGEIMGFLIQAFKDPVGANLDRVQIIKGWVDSDGQQHEKVFDVLWSGERQAGDDGKVPAIESTVNTETARYENSNGAAQLSGYWEDPEFKAGERAFYYARVLEIPTPRHSLYDAVALKIDVAETGMPASIQERAWSSPVWYTPAH